MLLFTIGDVVCVSTEIDYQPHANIQEGETGRVVGLDPELEGILVRLDTLYKALHEWDNCIHLVGVDLLKLTLVAVDYAVPVESATSGRCENDFYQRLLLGT